MNDKPTKNASLEAQVANLTAKLEATEQRAAETEQALADKRTPEEKYVEGSTAAVVAALRRDIGWPGPAS